MKVTFLTCVLALCTSTMFAQTLEVTTADMDPVAAGGLVYVIEHAESARPPPQAVVSARNLTSEQEIVRRSQQYAAEIVTKAQAQAKELSRNATVYCEGILKNSEEALARSVADIKNVRMNLRSAARQNRGQQK